MPNYLNETGQTLWVTDISGERRVVLNGERVLSYDLDGVTGVSVSDPWPKLKAQVSGQNQWVGPLPVKNEDFDVNITGIKSGLDDRWVGAVQLKRSSDGGDTFGLYEAFTGVTQKRYLDADGIFKLGIPAGGFSGEYCVLELSKNWRWQ